MLSRTGRAASRWAGQSALPRIPPSCLLATPPGPGNHNHRLLLRVAPSPFTSLLPVRRIHLATVVAATETMNLAQSTNLQASLVGGGIIGVATCVNLLFAGRVTGISGILNGVRTSLKQTRDAATAWRRAFIGGMIGGGAALSIFAPSVFGSVAAIANGSFQEYAQSEHAVGMLMQAPFLTVPAAIVAGFLVGFGTRMGSGCTSGHGVCGLARLSKRSFAAVLSFMASGITTASVLASIPALNAFVYGDASHTATTVTEVVAGPTGFVVSQIPYAAEIMALVSTLLIGSAIRNAIASDSLTTTLAGAASGGIFAAGLGVGGMLDADKVIAFLDLSQAFTSIGWDPSLMGVMGGAVGLNLIAFRYILKRDTPVCSPQFDMPTKSVIDSSLLIGSAIFGVGWGLAGMCPGPALVSLGNGSALSWLHVGSIIAGMHSFTLYQRLTTPHVPLKDRIIYDKDVELMSPKASEAKTEKTN